MLMKSSRLKRVIDVYVMLRQVQWLETHLLLREEQLRKILTRHPQVSQHFTCTAHTCGPY